MKNFRRWKRARLSTASAMGRSRLRLKPKRYQRLADRNFKRRQKPRNPQIDEINRFGRRPADTFVIRPFPARFAQKGRGSRGSRQSAQRTAGEQISAMRIIGGAYRGKNCIRRNMKVCGQRPTVPARPCLTFFPPNWPAIGPPVICWTFCRYRRRRVGGFVARRAFGNSA